MKKILNKLKKIFKKEKPVPEGTFNKLTMNATAKKQMIQDLKASENMNQVFEIFNKYYDLKNCKPGLITKTALIAQLDKAVIALNAKPKKEFA